MLPAQPESMPSGDARSVGELCRIALRKLATRDFAAASAPVSPAQVILAALYVMASGLISQELSFSDFAFSLFWPPAGIAFAFVWQYGYRALPSIALGIAVPTVLFYPQWGSLLVVIGETLGPLAGVALLRVLKPGQERYAEPLRWQMSFYACGFMVACPIAALFGSLGGLVDHRFVAQGIPGVFLAYLMVEAIGLVLFAPLVMEWLARESRAPCARLQVGHGPWICVTPFVIETIRWLLYKSVGGNYADLLIYCYFPLVAWCALTETSLRTNSLLVLTAIAVLSSQAWRAHELGSAAASFDLFRFALVILTLSAMGQVLWALANERRLAFAELAQQADLDPLTGLLNERSFARELDQFARPFTIVLLAFENWPEFEILAGIGASYDLQREMTDILRAEAGLLHLARLQAGGFGCIVAEGAAPSAALDALLKGRWVRGGVEMRLIGAALSVAEATHSATGELLLGARTLLNEARFCANETLLLRHWSPDMVVERRAYEILVDSIKHAVRNNRLQLYAQPILWVESPERCGLEILVRIEGDHGELLPSADVARVLAQNIVSIELDRTVIKATFDWFGSRRNALGEVERIAINLTGASLSSPGLFEWIERCREDAGLKPACFSFEITESQVILNMDAARLLIQRLRAAGYRVALDDFGTGLATFDYLKRFAVDYIKIDGSFVRNLGQNPIDLEIVSGIVRLARLMQIGTVAEYVESHAISAAVRGAGIDGLQGYLIAAPAPLAEVIEWCRSRQRVHSALHPSAHSS